MSGEGGLGDKPIQFPLYTVQRQGVRPLRRASVSGPAGFEIDHGVEAIIKSISIAGRIPPYGEAVVVRTFFELSKCWHGFPFIDRLKSLPCRAMPPRPYSGRTRKSTRPSPPVPPDHPANTLPIRQASPPRDRPIFTLYINWLVVCVAGIDPGAP